jgi:hypothetical protein
MTHQAHPTVSCGNLCSSHGHILAPGADFAALPHLPPPHGSADLWSVFRFSHHDIFTSVGNFMANHFLASLSTSGVLSDTIALSQLLTQKIIINQILLY